MGVPVPEYVWFFEGEELSVPMVPLLVFEASLDNRGSYFCTATNSQGAESSDTAFITLNGMGVAFCSIVT